MDQITYASTGFLDDVGSLPDTNVHMILIATKPDIIKQIPLYKELKQRGHQVILGHTGQHYDENLSGGMLKEFGVQPDFNLNVRGSMHEVVSQIIGRLGSILAELKARGKIVIPYVHGDTTTAMAASNAGYCHGFASVHVEAGIRTLTPDYEKWKAMSHKSKVPPLPSGYGRAGTSQKFEIEDVGDWREFLMDRKNWEKGSQEPYPEQFNTRCSEAASGIHLAPVELDKEFLLAEGFSEDRIIVVGNSVVDATEEAMKRAKNSTIFAQYPALEQGDFVRFCMHRRENCLSEKRFRSIYEAMKSLIVEGRKVLLISMIQTNLAFERFGLQAEVNTLAKKYPNFILSPVWTHYGDVIAAMSRASVCATDSGSMQEEMNAMGIPCVTLRFGSDRSESVLAGGNLIAPPVDAGIIKQMIDYAWNNEDMKKAPKIYGNHVSSTRGTRVSTACINAVEKILQHDSLFRSDEKRLGFAH